MPNVYDDLRSAVAAALRPVPNRRGYLGYVIDGAMTIEVTDDPSRVYVRYPNGAYDRVLHKQRVARTPVADVQGTAVLVNWDSEGWLEIVGIDSRQAPGIVFNRGQHIQTGDHTHAIDDIDEIGDGTPNAGSVLLGDGDSWESTPLEEAIDSVISPTPVEGFFYRNALGEYVIVEIPAFVNVDDLMNSILTDVDGNILVDADGNVLTDGSYG